MQWPRWKVASLLALAGGVLFVAVFAWRYAAIDPRLYTYRDDGIITLSHSRNWIDFGFIGVNPSGERIEATSAPLQFLLHALAYATLQAGPEGFMRAQTLLCTFMMGALFALLFADRPRFALGACAAAAVALTQLPSFLLWHGSGMENALTHVFLLATVVVLVHCAETGRVRQGWVVVPFLASITRIEAIYHVAPVMVLFAAWWTWKKRDRQAIAMLALLAVLWLLFNAGRYAYFGSLLPNTAVAQEISVGKRLGALLTLDRDYLAESFMLARGLYETHGAYLLLLLPILMFREPRRSVTLRFALAASLVATSLFAPFVFGMARLDWSRTTTQMALFVLICVAAAACEWRPGRSGPAMVAVLAIVVVLLHLLYRLHPRELCCGTRHFDETRMKFLRLAREHGIARPTVANADLGIVSWHKQMNVVDLGKLGSSLLPRIETLEAHNAYVFDYAAPDMLEIHGRWRCHYGLFLLDRRFTATYQPAGFGNEWEVACNPPTRLPGDIWIRRDILRGAKSAERVLMDDLARELSVARIEAELRACRRNGTDPARCAYVARSVYRVLPELRAMGAQTRLESIFRQSPSHELDLHLIRGAEDATTWRAALAALHARYNQ